MKWPPQEYEPGLIGLGEEVGIFAFDEGELLTVRWTKDAGYAFNGGPHALEAVERHQLIPGKQGPTDRAEGLGVFLKAFTDPETGAVQDDLQEVRLDGLVQGERFVLLDASINEQPIGFQRVHSLAQLLEVTPVTMIYTGQFAPEVLVAARHQCDVVVVPKFERGGPDGERAIYLSRHL